MGGLLFRKRIVHERSSFGSVASNAAVYTKYTHINSLLFTTEAMRHMSAAGEAYMCLPSILMNLIMQRRAAARFITSLPHHVERDSLHVRFEHKTATKTLLRARIRSDVAATSGSAMNTFSTR